MTKILPRGELAVFEPQEEQEVAAFLVPPRVIPLGVLFSRRFSEDLAHVLPTAPVVIPNLLEMERLNGSATEPGVEHHAPCSIVLRY